MYKYAIVRQPGENFSQGLTTANLGKPEFGLLCQQHRHYIDALKKVGLQVIILPVLPDYPDCYFVEDTAIITPEIAVISRPGAPARQGEESAMKPELLPYRPIEQIQAPGSLDGGDVLIVGKNAFIGLSSRTNEDGAKQLAGFLKPFGYCAHLIPIAQGLHLKSNINFVGKNTLILTAEFAALTEFSGYDKIIVDDHERYAANCLWLNDHLLIAKGFPETLQQLGKLGLSITELDMSEVQKMDGGLTCLSLRF